MINILNILTDARLDCKSVSENIQILNMDITHTCDLLRLRFECKGDIITTILVGP